MRAASKHSAILVAATKIFAKKGFFNARISDIAKEAKIADGTVYLYFNNKHDILISVFEEEIGKLLSQTEKIINRDITPHEMLSLFITNHLRVMKKNRYLAEVIQSELRQADKTIKKFRNTKFTEYLAVIADIIVRGQKQGSFRADINPDIMKRVIFGALDEVSRAWNISLDINYSIEETSNQLITFLLNGLSQSSTTHLAY